MGKRLWRFFFQNTMAKLVNRYMDQRIDERRSFEEQLGELDDRLKKEKIDLQERDRLIFLLQTQFYHKQEKQWKQLEKELR
jgi:hypothetical protein